ncbi:MAG: phosphoribosylformylglycinamidine synthase subunit PurQ [Pirellulaceae bacterium]
MPRVLILRAPGTNCDVETAFAFERAGGQPDRVHVNRLLENPKLAEDFQILCIPGGFSFGDDIAAGRILANQIRHHLADVLQQFKDDGKLILGICNGFQVLIRSGSVLLPESVDGKPAATLTWNDSGRFTDRWVNLRVDGSKCVFLRGIEHLYLPIAHAEGKFVPRDEQTLHTLQANEQLALRYAPAPQLVGAAAQAASASQPPLTTHHSPATTTSSTAAFNPNGSIFDTAGVCDATGRVFGLMPHPERHLDFTHHPRWTRGEGGEKPDGLLVFENAVGYFR